MVFTQRCKGHAKALRKALTILYVLFFAIFA